MSKPRPTSYGMHTAEGVKFLARSVWWRLQGPFPACQILNGRDGFPRTAMTTETRSHHGEITSPFHPARDARPSHHLGPSTKAGAAVLIPEGRVRGECSTNSTESGGKYR